jgi:hypothetical protein
MLLTLAYISSSISKTESKQNYKEHLIGRIGNRIFFSFEIGLYHVIYIQGMDYKGLNQVVTLAIYHTSRHIVGIRREFHI